MRNGKRILCLLLALLTALSLSACRKTPKLPTFEDFPDSYVDALPEKAEDGLTLHAFNWSYAQIRENLPAIAYAGFKNVLVMPVQQPKSGGSAWWAFYQPLSFSIGDASPLGSKEELAALCSEAEQYGVCILADIVANHMATTDDEGKEPDGTPSVCPAVQEYEPKLYLNRNEDTDGTGVTFHHNRGASGSGTDTQYYAYGNLPDLDTSNPYVQQRELALLKECIDVGIDGFRFDAAKHIETASDPDYPSDFWENTLEEAKRYYEQKTGRQLYVYGEILSSPTARSLENYTRYMRVTDDGFAAQFKSAFASKDPAKILNAALKLPEASKLIAWVESHDEYISSNTHYSEQRVAKFWSVIAAKKDLGGLYLARPTEELTVGKIGSYAFENETVAACNRFHNRFFDADSYESVCGSCYINEKIKLDDQGALILSVAEVDTDRLTEIDVPHLDDGNYYDAISGALVVVTAHRAYVPFDASGFVILTRSPAVHPSLELSERGGLFVGEKSVIIRPKNAEEAYYYFNGNKQDRHPLDGETEVRLDPLVQNGAVTLTVVLKNGALELTRSYQYRQVRLVDGYYNVLNLPEQYLNGDYELYLWCWSPGRWSRDYEIRDGVLLVKAEGMSGFLVAVFEKGYEIPDLNNWDSHVLKQSADIKGELLERGYADLSGF